MACRLEKNKNGKVVGVKINPAEFSISDDKNKTTKTIIEISEKIVNHLQNTGLAKDVVFLDTNGIQEKLNSINGRYGVNFQKYKKDLLAIHNLSADNILHVNELGGLAVPSIAIIKSGYSFNRFGEISLLGKKDIIDPMIYGNEVYSGDAYSIRHPRKLYKVSKNVEYDIQKEMGNGLFEHNREAWLLLNQAIGRYELGKEINTNSAENVFKNVGDKLGYKLAFLYNKGISIRPPKVIPDITIFISEYKPSELSFLVKKYEDLINKGYDNLTFEEKKSFSDDIIDFFLKNKDKEVRESMIISLKKWWLHDDGTITKIHFKNIINGLYKYLHNKKVIDNDLWEKRINEKFTKKLKQEYKEWFIDIISKYQGSSYFEQGNKKIPYTLNNIIDYMIGSVIGREKTLTHGVSKAKAKMSKALQSIDDIRQHKNLIVSKEEIKKLENEANKIFDDLTYNIVRYYKYDDTWDALDSITKAVVDRARGMSAERALSKNGFKYDPTLVIKLDNYTNALKNMPVKYFEAKVQRKVNLNEFKVAIVPNGTNKEVVNILRKNGIKINYYDSHIKGDREEKVRKAAERNRLLFSKDDQNKIKGFVFDNTVYLNIDEMSLDTPIHEFGHLWINYVKDNNYSLYTKGIELVEKYGKEYILKALELQPNLSDIQLKEEALAQLIGDSGALIVEKSRKNTILQWINELWNILKGMFGISDRIDDLSNVTLSEFSKLVAVDLLKGTNKVQFTSPYTITPLLDAMLSNKKGKYISVISIKQILNKQTTKKIEKDIINEVLELEKFKGNKKIFFNEFVSEVQSRITPLRVIESDTYSEYGSESVNIDLQEHSSHIYTSHISHNYTGHFSNDLGIRDDNEITLKIVPLKDKFAVVRDGVELNEDNVAENVLTIKSTKDDAQYFIDTFKNNKIKGGLVGHTRIWVDNNHTDIALMAEIQSDTYQKRNPNELLLEYYDNNRSKIPNDILDLFNEWDKNKEKLRYLSNRYTRYYDKFIDKSYPFNLSAVYDNMKYLLENNEFNFDLIQKGINKMKVDEYISDGDGYSFTLPLGIYIDYENDIFYVSGNIESAEFDNLKDAVKYINSKLKSDVEFKKFIEYVDLDRNVIPELENKIADYNVLDKQFISLKKYFTHRLLREEIRLNAQKGYKQFAMATPLTLARIEGYIGVAYEVVSSNDHSHLEDGDTINYLGDDAYVVDSNPDSIWVVDANEFNIVDLDEYIKEQVEYNVENDKYEFEQLFEDEYISEKEYNEYKYDLPHTLKEVNLEDISEKTDRMGIYKLNMLKLENILEEYYTNEYKNMYDDDFIDIFKEYGYYNIFIRNNKIYYTENDVDSEILPQPSQNIEIDYEDINEEYRPILKRYEKLNEWFKKERGDVREIEINGNTWLVTDLTEEDYEKPVVAFQIGNNDNSILSQVYDEFVSNPLLYPIENDNTITEKAIQEVKLLEQTNEIEKNCK